MRPGSARVHTAPCSTSISRSYGSWQPTYGIVEATAPVLWPRATRRSGSGSSCRRHGLQRTSARCLSPEGSPTSTTCPPGKSVWRVVGGRGACRPRPRPVACIAGGPGVRRHVRGAAAYSSSPQTPPSCSRSRSRIRAIASVGGRLENASHLMPPTSSRTARSSSPSSITQARLSLPVYTHPYPSRADRARAHPPTVAGVEEIDPLGPTPVYRQLARILRDRIASGDLAPNRPIPSEAQLRQEYGVARGTARKAVQVLRDERLVVTVTGRGTYVRPRP